MLCKFHYVNLTTSAAVLFFRIRLDKDSIRPAKYASMHAVITISNHSAVASCIFRIYISYTYVYFEYYEYTVYK